MATPPNALRLRAEDADSDSAHRERLLAALVREPEVTPEPATVTPKPARACLAPGAVLPV